MGFHYGAYLSEPCGGLHLAATGQRLLVRAADRHRLVCDYLDAEVTQRFEIALLGDCDRGGGAALLDWNRPALRDARARYGLWRRVTWFMLDALLVWLHDGGRPQQRVLVRGGWFDGAWLTRGRFQASWYDGGTGRHRLKEDIAPFAPFPLDGAPPRWRYEPGREGAVVGAVAVVPGSDPPRADLGRPVAEQLAHVPRFVADDGTIYFFHRLCPFGGPEYTPTMRHGIATRDYVVYVAASYKAAHDRPLPLRPGARPAQPVLIDEAWAADGALPQRTWPETWRLHPMLREAIFFAGSEASALIFPTPHDRLPEMRPVERPEVSMRFGSGMADMNDAPFSVGLPTVRLSSLPRLASEREEHRRGAPGAIAPTHARTPAGFPIRWP